jgi:hypothetical protein
MQYAAGRAANRRLIAAVLDGLMSDVGVTVFDPIMRQQTARADDPRQIVDMGDVIQPNALGDGHKVRSSRSGFRLAGSVPA